MFGGNFGLITGILSAIGSIFKAKGKLPAWAEDVLNILDTVGPIINASCHPDAGAMMTKIENVKGKIKNGKKT